NPWCRRRRDRRGHLAPRCRPGRNQRTRPPRSCRTRTSGPDVISSALPALDAHAHIAPDVTPAQIAALGQSVVFAMTRSLHEARQVKNRRDSTLVWGIGVHPGVAAAREAWDP